MKKSTRRWLGGLAIAAGAVGAGIAYLGRKDMGVRPKSKKDLGNVWARPGMSVTFRAELMPGRDRDERTFRVLELLPSGRVLLQGFDGEHNEKEFEAIHK
jgi:hypothetical protein